MTEQTEVPVLNIYEVSYPGVYDEYPDYVENVIDETSGKARYRAYLSFLDCSDITFMEYVKMTKIKKIGDTKPLPEERYFAQERIDLINELMLQIGSCGRRFLYSHKHESYNKFYWGNNRLWLVDHYTGQPMNMVAGQHQPTQIQESFFSGGGTLWGLMCDFTDYILGDDDSNGNHGYGGLYAQYWGYPEEDITAIREYAKSVGYLK